MNKQTIRKFLDSIMPGVEFKFKYGNDNTCQQSPALVDRFNKIWINRYSFRKLEQIEQKAILLHEVGHILTGDFPSAVDQELYAHLIAMQLAKNFHEDQSIYLELKRMIISWKEYDWNQDHGVYRRYILASKKYLKGIGK